MGDDEAWGHIDAEKSLALLEISPERRERRGHHWKAGRARRVEEGVAHFDRGFRGVLQIDFEGFAGALEQRFSRIGGRGFFDLGDDVIDEDFSPDEVVGHQREHEHTHADDDGHDLTEPGGGGDRDRGEDEHGHREARARRENLRLQIDQEALELPVLVREEHRDVRAENERQEQERHDLREIPAVEVVPPGAAHRGDQDGAERVDHDGHIDGVGGCAHDAVAHGHEKEGEHDDGRDEDRAAHAEEFSEHDDPSRDRLAHDREDGLVLDFAADGGGGRRFEMRHNLFGEEVHALAHLPGVEAGFSKVATDGIDA